MNAQCIERPELASFIKGKIPESRRAEEIASHVDECEFCQDTVVALAGNEDTFVDGLKGANEVAAVENEGAFRHGLQRLLAGMQRAAESPTEPTLTRIGPYVIEEKLGVGGMGTVYRAQHSKLKRTVALKVLPAERWASAGAISRFEREMEAIGQLDHPHIVRASDAGEDQGMHYLVMEFVDGLDLGRLTRRMGSIPVAEACELARQAAIGLQHAHDHGLVHRDIKPSNLMLAWGPSGGISQNTEPTLKILDLGLALLGDEHLREEHDVTTVGALMGTLDYMSPEQGVDSHAVDHRADIYGLGATLFKLLAGRPPYADPQYSTLMKKMTALATKAAPSLAAVRPDLPAHVVEVVDRMLARDPDDRFASAREVAEALSQPAKGANLGELLREALDTDEPDDGSLTFPLGRLNSAAAERGSRPIATAQSRGGDKGRRVGRWLIAAAAGFAILSAGIVYRISTDFGDVVVRSEDPNVQVVIKKGEKIERIELEQGKGRTRVRSGEYIVEIVGDSTGLKIEPAKLAVTRKGEVHVRIDRDAQFAAASEPPVAVSDLRAKRAEVERLKQLYAELGERYRDEVEKQRVADNTASSVEIDLSLAQIKHAAERMKAELNEAESTYQKLVENAARAFHLGSPESDAIDEPRYDGRTLQQWLAEVKNERKPERLGEAIRAVAAMARHPANAELLADSMDAIFGLMRQYGRKPVAFSGNLLNERAWLTLVGWPLDELANRILGEISAGNDRSRDFLIYFLSPTIAHDLQEDTVGAYERNNKLLDILKSNVVEIAATVVECESVDQEWAVDFLFRLREKTESNFGDVEGIVKLYQDALQSSSDDRVIAMAALRLVEMAPDTPRLVERINVVLAKQVDESNLVIHESIVMVVQAIDQLGPKAAAAAPGLLELLKSNYVKNGPNFGFGTGGYGGGFGGGIGGMSAGDAEQLQLSIIRSLGSIGSEAKPAIPYLLELDGLAMLTRPAPENEKTRMVIRDAILRIAPSLEGPIALIVADGQLGPVNAFGEVVQYRGLPEDLPHFVFGNDSEQKSVSELGSQWPYVNWVNMIIALTIGEVQGALGQGLTIRYQNGYAVQLNDRTLKFVEPLRVESGDGKLVIEWGLPGSLADIELKTQELHRAIEENMAKIRAHESVRIDLRSVKAVPVEVRHPAGMSGGFF